MLRPEQIANAKFTPVSAGAYSAEEVDKYIAAVAAAYKEIQDENEVLNKKIRILADTVEKYRGDEDAIKAALLDAHKMADSVTKSSKENADAAIAGANAEAERIKTNADKQALDLVNAARTQAADIVTNARNAVASIQERARTQADETLANANKESQKIIGDAEKQSAGIIGNSKKMFEFYSEELKKVKAELQQFRTMVEMLCNGEKKPEDIPEFINEPEIPDLKAPAAAEIPVPQAAVQEPVQEPEVEAEAEEPAPVQEPEIPAETAEQEPAAQDDEDDFDSFLSELDLDDSDDSGISADIDSLIPDFAAPEQEAAPAQEEPEAPAEPSVPASPEAPAEPSVPASPEADDDDIFGDLDDDFDALDIPSADDSDDDDDDITSLFDSLFD